MSIEMRILRYAKQRSVDYCALVFEVANVGCSGNGVVYMIQTVAHEFAVFEQIVVG